MPWGGHVSLEKQFYVGMKKDFETWDVDLTWVGQFFLHKLNFETVTLYAKKGAPSKHILQFVNMGNMTYKTADPVMVFVYVHFPMFVSHLRITKFLSRVSLYRCPSVHHYLSTRLICCKCFVCFIRPLEMSLFSDNRLHYTEDSQFFWIAKFGVTHFIKLYIFRYMFENPPSLTPSIYNHYDTIMSSFVAYFASIITHAVSSSVELNCKNLTMVH